jgi:asparagine synthase (glutamine-hydrolysing)
MLIGAAGPLAGRLREAAPAGFPRDPGGWLEGAGAIAATAPWGVAGLDRGPGTAADPATGSWLVLSGRPVLLEREIGSLGDHPARWLLEALGTMGWQALERVDGGFGIAWYDGRCDRLHLLRDRFGMEPLFYSSRGPSLLFASRIRDLRATSLLDDGLSGQGLAEFLTFCFVPGSETLDAGVLRVPPGSRLSFDPARGTLTIEHWYRLSFSAPSLTDEAEIRLAFRGQLERATVRRLEGGVDPGVLLSGGMDSSAVATLVRRAHAGPLYTYSFRCDGPAFDESYYARALAKELGTRHTEVPYGEAEAMGQRELVSQAEVPFCNVGINVGTWILGRAARAETSYVLTGDGGDEFWGSHPVYAIQRLARYTERLPMPRVAYRALIRALRLVRDSDRKRDLRAVLKRILPPDDVPRALGPYRWLTYFRPADYPALLTPAALALVRDCDPFRAVIDAYEGYQGPDDNLSPHLYNDYVTASGYYFSRLALLRGLGVEARCPFYDRDLVELGARIPARLKLEGIERTKRLFREAMEGVLPDVVNHRRDKLGHSVPLKSWLRRSGPLSAFLEEVLAPSALEARGLIRAEPVATLIREHRERRQNHAHRLWALLTLQLWLRARDNRGAGPVAA